MLCIFFPFGQLTAHIQSLSCDLKNAGNFFAEMIHVFYNISKVNEWGNKHSGKMHIFYFSALRKL